MRTPGSLSEIIGTLIQVVGGLLNIVILLAFLVFTWGIAQFILTVDNESKKSQGKTILVWGVIVLFVLVSIKGIIAIVLNTIL